MKKSNNYWIELFQNYFSLSYHEANVVFSICREFVTKTNLPEVEILRKIRKGAIGTIQTIEDREFIVKLIKSNTTNESKTMNIEQRIKRLEEATSMKKITEDYLEDEENSALDEFCEYVTQFFREKNYEVIDLDWASTSKNLMFITISKSTKFGEIEFTREFKVDEVLKITPEYKAATVFVKKTIELFKKEL